MAGEIIGVMRCPICDEEADLKTNKNGNCYCFCPRSHKIAFSSADSKKIRSQMAKGEMVEYGKIPLKSLTFKEKAEDEILEYKAELKTTNERIENDRKSNNRAGETTTRGNSRDISCDRNGGNTTAEHTERGGIFKSDNEDFTPFF